MNPVITCRLTGKRGPGIDAHIIPESFYRLGDGAKRQPLTILSSGTLPQSKRSWTGEYDSQIVTAEGEAYFSDWDAYAYEFLLERTKKAVLYHNGSKALCVEVETNDYDKLKLFFISVLWRAGVSRRPFFRKVRLGPHEGELRRCILEGDPGDFQNYGVLLYLYPDTPKAGFPMVSPRFFREKDSRCNFYEFEFGCFGAWIKVDSKPCQNVLSDFFIRRNHPVQFIVRNQYRKTAGFRGMVETIRQFHDSGPKKS